MLSPSIGYFAIPILKVLCIVSLLDTSNDLALILYTFASSLEKKNLKNYLKKFNLLANNPNPFYHYYLTDYPQRFKKIAERFLGEKIDFIEKIKLVDLDK